MPCFPWPVWFPVPLWAYPLAVGFLCPVGLLLAWLGSFCPVWLPLTCFASSAFICLFSYGRVPLACLASSKHVCLCLSCLCPVLLPLACLASLGLIGFSVPRQSDYNDKPSLLLHFVSLSTFLVLHFSTVLLFCFKPSYTSLPLYFSTYVLLFFCTFPFSLPRTFTSHTPRSPVHPTTTTSLLSISTSQCVALTAATPTLR